MTVQLDSLDTRALRAVDPDFSISADGMAAVSAGEIEVEVVRESSDRYRLRFKFPGTELIVRIAREQLLRELDIKADES